MVKTYLDVINDARDELGQGTIALSRLNDTDAEVKKCRACIQAAVRDLLAKHVSIPSENFVAVVSTVPSQSLLTNVISNPWDTKMIREIFWLDTVSNDRKRVNPVTLGQVKDLELVSFAEPQPQFYYQKGNDIYLLPTPDVVYTVHVRYSRTIPLLGITDLTTQLDLDNEGILILTDLTRAYFMRGKDPEWKTYLAEAQANAQDYYQRVNYGTRKQGVQSTMRVSSNSADTNY